jgi:hypothetical protein
MRCKTCGAKLIEVGYPKFDLNGFPYQEYRCPNGCEDIFGLDAKVKDFLSTVALAVIYTIVFILILPAYIAHVLANKIRSLRS